MLYTMQGTKSLAGREEDRKRKKQRNINREMAYVMPGLAGSIRAPGVTDNETSDKLDSCQNVKTTACVPGAE